MRLALAGDTMLGRGVAEAIEAKGPTSLFAPGIRDLLSDADLVVLNLECCISNRGERWPDPRKPFFFRAPLTAAETLLDLGVDCVTLANNHALDFGVEALADTLEVLSDAGIATTGAGRNVEEARRPAILDGNGRRLCFVGVTDHPADFAAGSRPGVAFADLQGGQTPTWLTDLISDLAEDCDDVIVTPHWGPNMTTTPRSHVRAAARSFLEAGATLIAGHSAHVFHGIDWPVLYDLGDFVDDYAVDPQLRNDLGLLWLVDFDASGPKRVEVVPLALDFCFTRLANDDESAWIATRFRRACAEFDTEVHETSTGSLVTGPI
ncbi:MAG: CapA family protein [Acidimicrobiia bacterium]